MPTYQEWRKQKLQARILATGESDTSDLTEKHYIKYLEEEVKRLEKKTKGKWVMMSELK